MYLNTLLKVIGFFISILTLTSCHQREEKVKLNNETKAEYPKKFDEVIEYYSRRPEDTLKLRAANFLIENMADQFYYDGEPIKDFKGYIDSARIVEIERINSLSKSMSSVSKEKDYEVITPAYLIENIELAFRVWDTPWSRHLTFEQFCEYILPYKSGNECPENWRKSVFEKYSTISDSCSKKGDMKEVCNVINRELKSWFTVGLYYNYPIDLGFHDIQKTKIGDCSAATKMTLYPMRAVGIPVAVDYTPNWANRSLGHHWNALIGPTYTMPFVGGESFPGKYKVEFVGLLNLKYKRAKVFRKTFAVQEESLAAMQGNEDIPFWFYSKRFKDVTNEYVRVSDVHIKLSDNNFNKKFAYLCIFDNKNWIPIYWGKIDTTNTVMFKDMGRDVAYLPVVYQCGELIPIASPFLLDKKGDIHQLVANTSNPTSVKLWRKYPEDDTNKIEPGDTYEVFYWDDEWISLGKQKAKMNYLIYNNFPSKALFWIRNLDRGKEERIFTMEDHKQIWW